MELSKLFLLEMEKIFQSNFQDSQRVPPINEKLLDLYLKESETVTFNISDQRLRQRKIMEMLTVLYPISFANVSPDQLEDPKLMEYLRKSKKLSYDLKNDLQNLFHILKLRVPKIYEELGIGAKEYIKRIDHVRLKRNLKKGLREFEKANLEMSREEKADIHRIFHDFQLSHLDPIIYIAEVLEDNNIGSEVLSIFLEEGCHSFNNVNHKLAILRYKKELLNHYLEHKRKFPTNSYILDLKDFESTLLKQISIKDE